MEREFVTYDIGKDFKFLGFNGYCMAMFQKNKKLWYTKKGEWIQNFKEAYPDTVKLYEEHYPNNVITVIDGSKQVNNCVNYTAPLWQQAIDWLREKYGLDIVVKFPDNPNGNEYEADKLLYDIHVRQITGTTLIDKISYVQYSDDFYEARKKSIEIAIDYIKASIKSK